MTRLAAWERGSSGSPGEANGHGQGPFPAIPRLLLEAFQIELPGRGLGARHQSLKKAWVEALEDRVQGVKQRVEEAKQRMGAAAQRLSERRGVDSAEEEGPTALRAQEKDPLAEATDLPVVARLIVEIRSDGSRTLARGALEDVVTGERVQIEANGGSPAQLAASLAGSLLTTPFALGRYARAVVRQRLRRGDGER